MSNSVKQDIYYRFGWIFLSFVSVVVFFVLSRELTGLLAAMQTGSLGIRQFLGIGMIGTAILGMLAKNKRGFSCIMFLIAFGLGIYLLLWYGTSFAAIGDLIASGQTILFVQRYASLSPQIVALLYVFVLPGLAWILTLIGLAGHGASKFTKFLITLLMVVIIGSSVLLMVKDPAITVSRSILPLALIPWFFVMARGTYGENYEPVKTTAVATRGNHSDSRDNRRYDGRRDDRREDDRRYDDRRDDRRYDDRRYDDRRYDDRRYDDRRDDRGYDDRRYDDRRYDDRRDPVDDRRLPANIRSKEKPSGSGSEFTGPALGLIGVSFVAFLVSVITLSFGLPAMVCYRQRWMARHTIIDNRHMSFDGSAGKLFGKWIGWLILTVLTVGIFLFFIPMRLKKWVISHTHLK